MVYLSNYLISAFPWKTEDNQRRNSFRERERETDRSLNRESSSKVSAAAL
jgi:hypothetical protein